MDSTGILALSVAVLAIGVLLIAVELMRTKRSYTASVSLQLAQRMRDPQVQSSIARVRQLNEGIGYSQISVANNGHLSDDHSPLANGHLSSDHSALANGHVVNEHGPLANGHVAVKHDVALSEVDHYFGHIGSLVRRGVADHEVFALMGPTISEMWHGTRTFRAQDGASPNRDFEWLYTEWLNYDFAQRHSPTAPHDYSTNAILN